jgi:hypothetical protein
MRLLPFSVKVCSQSDIFQFLIIDLSDDFTGTGSQEKNQAFRAIRRALWECKHAAIGIFTDTNSSVANLVPSKERDPSVCNIFIVLYFLSTLIFTRHFIFRQEIQNEIFISHSSI